MIKKLTASVRQYKKASILAPLTVVVEVLMEILIPLIMAELIDKGIDQGNMNAVWMYGGLLLVAAIVSLIFGALAGKYAAIASSGFARNLRHDMYYKIQEYSFANIDKFSTSSIITRLTTDVTNVQNAYQMLLRMAVRCPVMLIFAMVVSFGIDAQLSLVFLCAIPILGFGLWLIMSRVHPIFERVFKTYDKLNRIVQENLRGIRVVKSFTREDFELNKFEDVSQTIYKDFSKAEKTLAFNMPLMQFSMYACTLIVCWMGARAIVACGGDAATGLSTGEFLSLITYATQILMSLMMVSMVFVMITISRASAERIVEILNEESTLSNCENPIHEVKDGSIVFEDVSFAYSEKNEKPVLDHININIKSGQTIGILGGTGSSKSSLVQLIPRLYDVSSGRVTVGGVDVREYDIESLRNQVAMVLQKNELFSGTIKENLRWGNENATDEEIIDACKLAQADEFIQQFPDKYDTWIEQGGTNVSGGQKQRLCIARALLKKPKILILDDSTSAVDTRTDALIRQGFREFIPETTKIIIAQRVASVQDADRIILMEGGRIIAIGSHDELMETNQVYREIYTSQNRAGGDKDGE